MNTMFIHFQETWAKYNAARFLRKTLFGANLEEPNEAEQWQLNSIGVRLLGVTPGPTPIVFYDGKPILSKRVWKVKPLRTSYQFLFYILLIISIFSCSENGSVEPPSLNSNEFYIATWGEDSNPGTFEKPWATLKKAFNTVKEGNTVYMRGGIYYYRSVQFTSNLHGTKNAPIRFHAYPPDFENNNPPIIDGSKRKYAESGIILHNSSHIELKGIVIRNMAQFAAGARPHGLDMYQCNNMLIENCVAHDIGFRGFRAMSSTEIRFKNCDAYNIIDPLSSAPGNHGDGFIVWDSEAPGDEDARIYFEGCRAWNCADDGFDTGIEGLVVLENCWSFANGRFESGDGNGFKWGLTSSRVDTVQRVITNCLAAYNRFAGFNTNDKFRSVKWANVFNNTSYSNDIGFIIFDTADPQSIELNRVFRNNTAYANTSQDILSNLGAGFSSSNNSWDLGMTITDGDFISVDSTGLAGPRKADWSLPDLDFLKLAPGSELIDAGIDVGLPFSGRAPDLGAFEKMSF